MAQRPSGPSTGAGHLAEGLWAMLDPGCQSPDRVDTRAWPRCASPFWISHQAALIVRTRPGPDDDHAPASSYRADLHLIPGDPLIIKVGTPGDGYVYLALARLVRDDHGRLSGAVGAAFACRTGAPGPISLKPNAGGCELVAPEDLRRAARQSLRDESGLTRVAWVAQGVP
jgi:hypothetical protein